MHHTIGRNRHASVPQSVQQLVSVAHQMPILYTSLLYHTGAHWFWGRLGMVVLWTAARRAAAASADAQGKCRAHKVHQTIAAIMFYFFNTRAQRVIAAPVPSHQHQHQQQHQHQHHSSKFFVLGLDKEGGGGWRV